MAGIERNKESKLASEIELEKLKAGIRVDASVRIAGGTF